MKKLHRFLSLVLVLLLVTSCYVPAVSAFPSVREFVNAVPSAIPSAIVPSPLLSMFLPTAAPEIDVCSNEYKQMTASSREKIIDACNAGSNHVLSRINSVGYDYNPSTGRLKLYKCQNLKYDLYKNMFPENNRVTYSCNILTDGATEKHLLDILDYITTANELEATITRSIKDTSFTIGSILAIAIGSVKANMIELNIVDTAGIVKYRLDHADDLKRISELYSKANTLYNSIAKVPCVICGNGLKIGAGS